ncbi:glucose 1-dehydrogenase [soil metagenome]
MSRAALITGGSRGIGLAIAHGLAQDGWSLTLSARNADALADAAAELRSTGADVHVIPADMADPDAPEALAGDIVQRVGRLDALILSAGMGNASPIVETPIRRLDTHYAVNLRAPFELTSRLIPLMRSTAETEPNGVRVIAISSLTARAAEPGLAAYGATKAALCSFCETLNVEESANGILATAICPGYVDTEMSSWKQGELAADTMIRASDIAELAVSLTRLSRNAVVPSLDVVRPGTSMWRA